MSSIDNHIPRVGTKSHDGHGRRGSRRKRTAASRAEQLRYAKRAQRERERARGLVHVQLTLPAATAERLAVASRSLDFAGDLERLLDDAVVRIADYPALSDIAWNLAVPYLPARDAFGLYERNWRFVETERLDPREKALIARLAVRFGRGIIHHG